MKRICGNHNSKMHVFSLILQRFETKGKIIILTYYLPLKIILNFNFKLFNQANLIYL